MGKTIAVHSFKGGTGKTLISVNLAATFAKKGRNVCLLDYDFRAPSLQVVFKSNPACWLNDFLDGQCNLSDTFIEAQKGLLTPGALYVGLANPSSTATRQILSKDRRWEMRALQRLLSAKTELYDGMKTDYLIIDTSPGIAFSSLNAIVASDLVLLVSTLDESDIDGTKRMIQDTYSSLERKTDVLINRVLIELLTSEVERQNLSRKTGEVLGVRPLELIPCYCDVLRTSRTSILALDKPEHPLTKLIERISGRIASELASSTT